VLERPLVSFGGLVVGLALPPIFLHVDYQPGVGLHFGSTSVHVFLSDFMVLAVGLAGLGMGAATGFWPLRAGRWIWIAGIAFLGWILAATFYPIARSGPYDWHTHLVTAGKFLEYAVLAAALPLLLRRRNDLWMLLGALVAWSATATTVGVIQFFGGSISGGWPAGRRQPSFLGHHDFAALSGASLALAIVALALPAWRVNRVLAVTAGISGTIGLVVSGSTAGAIGLAVGAVAAAGIASFRRELSPRRLAALGAIAGIVLAGVVTLRAGDFDQLLRFLGVRRHETVTQRNVQTYVQHTLLDYIGLKIFLGHPVVGAGWQASEKEPSVYEPYLPAAHRRFPRAAPLSFPSPSRPYGIQNGYVQALADLGIVGFLLFVGLLAAGLLRAGRLAWRAPPAEAGPALVAGVWLLVAMGIWGAVGLVAGIPLDALFWLALGLTATVAAGVLHEPA
jgi:O-antigen ligase